MNVAELLNKLRIIANVEIVVALLPEMLWVPEQAPGHSLLQRFDGIGECVVLPPGWPTQARLGLSGAVRRPGGPFKSDFGLSGAVRFAEQQMNMLGHHYIAINVDSVTTPHPFQG